MSTSASVRPLTVNMASPVTVVHVFSGDLWAGAEQMIYALLADLQKRNRYNLMAVSMSQGTLPRKLIELGIQTHVIDESVHAFPVIVMKAYTLLRNKRVGLIHAHRYKENVLGGLLGKLLGVKALVSTMHGSLERGGATSRGPLLLVEKVNEYVLKHWFACVVPVSRELKTELVAKRVFDEASLAVVHNGIPIENYRKRARSEGRTLQIGTAGRLIEIKGLNLFIKVASEVRQAVPRVQFRILGDGPLKESLMERVKQVGLAETVIFEGYWENAKTFYEQLDVYLNTSIHEGLPLSILEAMAAGTPVVAPNVGGIPEVITDGIDGFLIAGRESRDFADRCVALLGNADLRERIGVEGRRTVMNGFSSAAMADAYERLYDGLVGRPENHRSSGTRALSSEAR